MGELYNLLFYNPILNTLIFFYKILGNFGLAIIFLTLFIRGLLIPLTLPAIRSARKMKDLTPELNKIKKKYNHDKKRLQQEQLKLYKIHGVNPASGCLPYILQFFVLIALYRAFMFFIAGGGKIDDVVVNTHFLWLDLAKPDRYLILPILAGASQLVLSRMVTTETQKTTETPRKVLDELGPRGKQKKKRDDTASAMGEMQKQMVYLMPLMTVMIGAKLPSGLALYWVVTTLFSVVQQRIVYEKK